MNDKLKKLILLQEMHSFQVIAVAGLLMSVLAQAIMVISGTQVDSFYFLYPTWAVIFLIGYFLNLQSKGPDHHH